MKTQADKKDLFNRDPLLFETDYAAVKAIVQAAVNVELFTIPLYMTTLYSIQGVHQITGQNSLYQGRLWPGLAPSFRPGTRPSKNIPENEKAFNTIFSVFIEEMLHLQLASNLATAVGVVPVFTQLSPKTANYAWSCYGPGLTEIPGILDFKDCKEFSGGIDYSNIKVKLDELNLTQNDLFLAIEAPEEEAKARIKESELHKYFPIAPFKDWQPGQKLPMFGSIGQMYQCLWDYLDITYEDDNGKVTTLWEKIYQPAAIQQDIFNATSQGHPYKEFQNIETTIEGWLPEKAKALIYKLICAITDQGEGADISKNLYSGLQAVQIDNQASNVALKADYPSFTDTGKPAPSTHAYARYGNGKQDHYERFEEIRDDLKSGKIITWPTWHKKVRPGLNKWIPEDLKTDTYAENKYPLPKAEEIAGALNRLNDPSGTGDLNDPKREANYQQFCEIATGAIAGITTVLDDFWANPGVGFPFPSMGGSGDRLMMCWAVFGQLPDLSKGVQPIKDGVLYHACQGLDLNYPSTADPATCASAEIYHNCRGSNSCKAQGGCGFVQQVGQSKSCGSSVMSLKTAENLCGGPTPPKPTTQTVYSAPGDNVCGSFGGCAVPISASQIYPVISGTGDNQVTSGVMELNNFGRQSPHPVEKIPDETITFNTGQMVHDIAWEAYTEVIKFRKQTPPEKPEPSDIRLAFPPST